METPETSLDAALDRLLDRFDTSFRLDHAHEELQRALHNRLRARGYPDEQLKLLEVNLFGSLTAWIEFVLKERIEGRDAVGDFARHLRRAFMLHCREHQVEPDEAVEMAVGLASSIMDLALAYRRHLSLHPSDDATPES